MLVLFTRIRETVTAHNSHSVKNSILIKMSAGASNEIEIRCIISTSSQKTRCIYKTAVLS